MSENNTDKRTATQRIEDLEKVLTSVYQAVVNHKETLDSFKTTKDELGMVKDVLKLLNKRVEAIVQAATPESGITQESVSKLLISMNVLDLTNQVQGYLAGGYLATTDTVADGTFLVCEELNSEGTVVNPRIQFRLDSQDQTTQDALKGKKAGETASFGENKLTARVLEVYTLTTPPAPTAPEATGNETPPAGQTENDQSAAPATETAPEASATETPAATDNRADTLPPESPVTEFVAPQPGTMATA